MSGSQMDTNIGTDTPDAGGYMPQTGSSRGQQPTGPRPADVIKLNFPIDENEFNASEYKVCRKVGKAVIVSNFMEPYESKQKAKNQQEDLSCRQYASEDCKNLEESLKSLGFEPLTGDDTMVHKNLTKKQFEELYKRVAWMENYRHQSDGNEDQGYTCVLFIVMSYGRSGLIKCHAAQKDGKHEVAELKELQEAFQPQHNNSLALKPKIFIVQTIPEETNVPDDTHGEEKARTTKRIPREADFLTYSSDSYCLKKSGENSTQKNIFVEAIVDSLKELAKAKEENRPALEIQRLLIRMNNNFKKRRESRSDWKIPCVTSSLTKQLKLF